MGFVSSSKRLSKISSIIDGGEGSKYGGTYLIDRKEASLWNSSTWLNPGWILEFTVFDPYVATTKGQYADMFNLPKKNLFYSIAYAFWQNKSQESS